MKLFFHPKATKFLNKLDKQISNRIISKIKELKENPKKGKLLSHSKFWSLRIGDYRIIYEIIKDQINILFIGHRKKVYDDFSKLFLFFF